MQHDTRTPARKVAVDPNHGLPAGVLGPVALIGPHLLEKEAAVGIRAKNGRRAQSPRERNRETKESHQQKKLTTEKTA
jgi:hypothetical protein